MEQLPYAKKVRQHIEQRNEWLACLQSNLTPQVESVLRKFYMAGVICHKKRPFLSVEDAYVKLLERSRTWSDEQVVLEIGERKADDAEICLHEAVKEHGKVLSLSTATPCRIPLDVPSIVKFFRSVLAASADDLSDNNFEAFSTTDISRRKGVREWIGDIIVHKALEIVPVSKFAGRNAPPREVAAPEIVAQEVKELPKVAELPKPIEALVEAPKIAVPLVEAKPIESKEEVVVPAFIVPQKSDEDEEEEDEEEEDDEEEDDDPIVVVK
jgi:hypothetical protein